MSSKVYRKTSLRASIVHHRVACQSLCQACGKARGSARYSTEDYTFLCARCYCLLSPSTVSSSLVESEVSYG